MGKLEEQRSVFIERYNKTKNGTELYKKEVAIYAINVCNLHCMPYLHHHDAYYYSLRTYNMRDINYTYVVREIQVLYKNWYLVKWHHLYISYVFDDWLSGTLTNFMALR